MKEETIRIANKNHKCDACEVEILKGEEYRFGSGRSPKYDENDKQIGIQFFKYKVHNYNCTIPDHCRNGEHANEVYVAADPDNYGEISGYRCEDCGFLMRRY